MTNTSDDPINPNVPDLFRPPLAPEERPVVKKWRARFAGALLIAVLVLGMSGVVFWQSMQAQTKLDKLKAENKTLLDAKKADAELFLARYATLDRVMTDIVNRAGDVNTYLTATPGYEARFPNIPSPQQKEILKFEKSVSPWVVERTASLDAMCEILGGQNTVREVKGKDNLQIGCGLQMRDASTDELNTVSQVDSQSACMRIDGANKPYRIAGKDKPQIGCGDQMKDAE